MKFPGKAGDMNGNAAPRLVAGQLEMDHPLIRKEEQRILELKRALSGSTVDAIIEIGQRLSTVKGSLKRGLWGRWLRAHIRYSPRTAAGHMQLAGFASSNSQLIANFKSLGANKLCTLSRISSVARTKMLARQVHQLPGDDRPKGLAEMNLAEFNALARRYDPGMRQRLPRVGEALRRGVESAERLVRVLTLLRHGRVPDSPRGIRFRALLGRIRELLAPFERVAQGQR